MSNILSMKAIKERDDVLYTKVLQEAANLTKGETEHNELIDKINSLIEDIIELSEIVDSFDDYRWLSNAITKWQSVFSTIFEAPRIIMLSQPKSTWLPPTPSVFTEKEINNWLKCYAEFIWYARRAESGRENSNPLYHWHTAEVLFASEVLDGKINFASRISSKSYWRLENIWLKEVKCLMAYFNWEWVKRKSIFLDHVRDYFEACNHIRKMLCNKKEECFKLTNFSLQSLRNEGIPDYVLESLKNLENKEFKEDELALKAVENTIGKKQTNKYQDLILKHAKDEKGIKARPSEFNEAKNYIQEHYLGEDGKLLPKERESKLCELIGKKACRIYETTGSRDDEKNWVHAETYVKMFYENIIPAVVEKDKEKVLRVLKAFQFSKMNHFLIINCFETALAIYFLDPYIIQRLWKESAEQSRPESTVESIVEVNSWPQNFINFIKNEHCEARFWSDRNRIGFKGVMLDIEKDTLLKALNQAEFGKPKEKDIKTIEELYNQSRLIHEETTL